VSASKTIQKYLVSKKEVASETKGAKERFCNHYAIAVTGKRRPNNDHNDKSAGLVYIAFVSG
jgi:nicotinamide-nucleotide amidase